MTTRISIINYFLFGAMNFLILAALIRLLRKKNIPSSAITKLAVSSLMAPILIVVLGPITKVLPAFPLSLKEAGVYYNVTRQQGTFQVEQKVATFLENLLPGPVKIGSTEPLYLFFKVISPVGIDDKIMVDWYHEGVKQDSIPIRLLGGRAEGFRAYTYKNNHQRGSWKAVVRTTDGLVIGTHSFDVVYGEKPPTEIVQKL